MDQSKNSDQKMDEIETLYIDTLYGDPNLKEGMDETGQDVKEMVEDTIVPPISDVVILTAIDIKEDINDVGEKLNKLGWEVNDTLNHAGEEIEKFGYDVEDTLNQA